MRDERAKARISQRIDRLAMENPGDVKSVGEGISELRIDYGPGYRVYFVRDGVIVLLCGGDKRTQSKDIERAKTLARTLKEQPMTLVTREYDSARYLESEESIAEYIAAASESGDPHELAMALGIVAKARGVTDLARQTGLTRQAIYKALNGDGNPELGTIAKVADALGFRLSLLPKSPVRPAA